jgi:hypothetical protein
MAKKMCNVLLNNVLSYSTYSTGLFLENRETDFLK